MAHKTNECPNGALFGTPIFHPNSHDSIGGGKGIRTLDPNVANVVLSQLSYAPTENFPLPLALAINL